MPAKVDARTNSQDLRVVCVHFSAHQNPPRVINFAQPFDFELTGDGMAAISTPGIRNMRICG